MSKTIKTFHSINYDCYDSWPFNISVWCQMRIECVQNHVISQENATLIGKLERKIKRKLVDMKENRTSHSCSVDIYKIQNGRWIQIYNSKWNDASCRRCWNPLIYADLLAAYFSSKMCRIPFQVNINVFTETAWVIDTIVP